MKAVLLFAAMLLGLGAAGQAAAADSSTEEARQHFLKGQQLFDVGRWDDAASEFEQAYAARNDPTFIYNMAQAYRRKGDAKRALELYKNYLIKAPKSPQRAEVEDRIDTLQKQVEESDRAAKATAPFAPAPLAPIPAPPPPAPEPTPAAMPAPAAPPAPIVPESGAQVNPAPAPVYVQSPPASPPPDGSPGSGLRLTGIVCGAAGLLAIGAGAFFSLETDDYSSTVAKGDVFNPNFDDRGKLYQTLQWVGYGVGAALVATGAVLYGLGVSARSSAVAVSPAVLPGGAGLTAQGVF